MSFKVGDIVEVTEDVFHYKKGDKLTIIKTKKTESGISYYFDDGSAPWEEPLVKIARYTKTPLWKLLEGEK